MKNFINIEKSLSRSNTYIKNKQSEITENLSNISNQLKNISISNKNKNLFFKSLQISSSVELLNNKNLNKIKINKKIKTNKPNFEKLSIINSNKFSILKKNIKKNTQLIKSKNESFTIKKSYKTFLFDDLKKENLLLKENIKFLLKQMKKYQKNSENHAKKSNKLANLQKEIIDLKNENMKLIETNSQISKRNNNNSFIKKNALQNEVKVNYFSPNTTRYIKKNIKENVDKTLFNLTTFEMKERNTNNIFLKKSKYENNNKENCNFLNYSSCNTFYDNNNFFNGLISPVSIPIRTTVQVYSKKQPLNNSYNKCIYKS